MLTRSFALLSSLLLAFSLLGCASTPAPKIGAAKQTRTIPQVTDDLQKRFAKDDRLQGSKVEFEYDGATVILNGTVKDKEQFGWASTVAAGTPGVKGVINRLQVESAGSEGDSAPQAN